MTVAISLVTPDGVVVAADSRTTYGSTPPRVLSDFTHKVFEVRGCAVATYGWAFLLRRNIAGHMAEFKQAEGPEPSTVEELAHRLAEFFGERIDHHLDEGLDPRPAEGNDVLGFMIGGYEQMAGRSYEVLLPSRDVVLLHDSSQNPGAAWRGQTDVIRRLIKGVDADLLAVLAQQAGKEAELAELTPLLDQMEYAIPLNFMNLQDAVDFALFAIRTTIDAQRLTNGVLCAPGSWPGVGGPIEIAAVTATQGFRWVQQTLVQGERPAGVAEGA